MTPYMLRDEIADLYSQLLPADFLAQPSAEPLASCNACRMCNPQHASPPYSPSTKCCTFYPFIPNYLVGGALKAGGFGAEKIRQLILDRQWTLPIGIVAPPGYQLRFNNKRPDEFGRNFDFICPFYKAGQCGIWRFRNSDCATYFCAHQEGEHGKARWNEIGDRLFSVEMSLSQECMLEKGYSWPEVENALRFIKITADIKGSFYEIEPLAWGRFWRHRSDDPDIFYRQCHDWVTNPSSISSLRATLTTIFAKTNSK